MGLETEWYFDNSVCLFSSKLHEDQRGSFEETYNRDDLSELGLDINFVQDSSSFSRYKDTFRGLHFQSPPFDQCKIIRVTSASILDLVLDLRKQSSTYLEHRFFEINSSNRKQLFIPSGFAHGFLTLEDNSEVFYKLSNFYNPDYEHSLSFLDKDLGIKLPIDKDQLQVSEKDLNGKLLTEIDNLF